MGIKQLFTNHLTIRKSLIDLDISKEITIIPKVVIAGNIIEISIIISIA